MAKSKHNSTHKKRAAKRRKDILEAKQLMRRQFEKFLKEQKAKNENSFILRNNDITPIESEGVL